MPSKLKKTLEAILAKKIVRCNYQHHETTLIIEPDDVLEVCEQLRDQDGLAFEQLVDLTVVDYLEYGQAEWSTENATASGFSRGRQSQQSLKKPSQRFAVVYHLLSVSYNHRLRVKCFLNEARPSISSVINIWNSADWYEREAFDLFGVLFIGHPDLRRLLTDYGFIGHPFRKDFPLIGNVEMRYDAKQKRCVYEPVSIQPRVLVPKVIRAEKDSLLYVADVPMKPGGQSG